MSDTAMIEVQRLSGELAKLIANLSPWISTDEMCQRYNCTPKTLNNMERDGRLPFRKHGKWSRNEVVKWESNLK